MSDRHEARGLLVSRGASHPTRTPGPRHGAPAVRVRLHRDRARERVSERREERARFPHTTAQPRRCLAVPRCHQGDACRRHGVFRGPGGGIERTVGRAEGRSRAPGRAAAAGPARRKAASMPPARPWIGWARCGTRRVNRCRGDRRRTADAGGCNRPNYAVMGPKAGPFGPSGPQPRQLRSLPEGMDGQSPLLPPVHRIPLPLPPLRLNCLRLRHTPAD